MDASNTNFGDYVSKVNKVDLDVIRDVFNIDTSVATKFIEHNRLFFGHLNMEALYLCIKSKMFSWNRPSSVNNSQWKWYTSDFCKLANKELKSNYKSQCIWTDSKALKLLSKINKIEIDKSDLSFEVLIEDTVQNVDHKPLLNFCSVSINKQTNVSMSDTDLNAFPSNRLGIALKNTVPIYEEFQKTVNGFTFDYDYKKIYDPSQIREMVETKTKSMISILNQTSSKLTPYKDALCNPERIINKNQASSWRKAVRELEKLDSIIPQQDRADNYNYNKIVEKERLCREKMQKKDPSEWVLPKYKLRAKDIVKYSMVIVSNFDKVLNLLNEYDEIKDNECDKKSVEVKLTEFCNYINRHSKKKTKFYKTSKRKKANKNRVMQKKIGPKRWSICDRVELFKASVNKINGQKFETHLRPKSIHSSASLLMRGIKKGLFTSKEKCVELEENSLPREWENRVLGLRNEEIRFSDIDDMILEKWVVERGLHAGFGWIFSYN